MQRVIWKGAISFGLVHVPVSVYPASQESGIDFDWLDKRTMDPVGYKRINKRTGKDIASSDVVRGVKQEAGEYVILSDEEIKAAYPKSTQTIEIEAFVKAQEIPFFYLEKPYFLTPLGKGEKVYVLLREAMLDLGVIGIARVVMHSKESLAALVPGAESLMLNTIRWAAELRSSEEMKFPAAGKSASGLKDAELRMAHQLVNDMTTPWKPEAYADRFTEAIHALAASRVKAGRTAQVTALEAGVASTAKGNVIDLTELLRRSLQGAKPHGGVEGSRGESHRAPANTPAAANKRTKGPAAAKASPRAVSKAAKAA
jgi:DNA end-binding protein Ku